MTNFHVVTCFGPGGWEKYAQKFHETFTKHVSGVTLHTYFHDCEKPEGLQATNLADTPNWPGFKQKWGTVDGKGNWRFDVAKFGNKVFAIADAAQKVKDIPDTVLIWIDADITFKAAPPWEVLFPERYDFYSLVRQEVYIESSVMGFRMGTPAEQLVWDVEELYSTGGFQRFAEWHDGFVYDSMATVMGMHGMTGFPWANTAKGQGSDAFNTSAWGEYAAHAKGNKKESKLDIVLRECKKNFESDSIYITTHNDPEELKKEIEAAREEIIILLDVEKNKPLFNALGDATFKRVILQTLQGDAGLLVRHHVKQKSKSAEVRIQPVDCVDSTITHANLDRNRALIKRWLAPCAPNGEEIVLVSAGPSAIANIDKIKELYDNGKKIVCVKHSYGFLVNSGIIPFACVILDPRPFDGISTHGEKRSELIKVVNPQTIFFVATMTIPESTEDLLAKGANVVGWNAFSDASKGYPWPEGTVLVGGGTCAALRAISICQSLGFRTMTLFGYDFSMPEITDAQRNEKDESGRQKYFKVSTAGQDGKRHFYSTGELMAGAQNLESLGKEGSLDITFNVMGDGLAQTLFREAGYKPKPHYSTWLVGLYSQNG